MQLKYNDKYLPVDPDFDEIIEQAINAQQSGKIHFWGTKNDVLLAEGKILAFTKDTEGKHLLVGKQSVRIDKIITLFGQPGPAYDLYDRYANVCFTCEKLD